MITHKGPKKAPTKVAAKGCGLADRAAFALQPVWMFNVCGITHLAQMATEGKERSIVSIKTETHLSRKERRYALVARITP